MTNLPDGWKLSTIGECAEIIRGVTYSKSETLSANDEDAIPLLRATNLEVDSIDFKDMVYVPKRLVKPQQILKLNDIFLAASSGSISVVGKSAQVIKTNGETFGAFCVVIRPKNINPKFLSYLVQSPEIRDHWSAKVKGTNINNLKPSDISETKIPIPPLPEQHKIVEILEDHLSSLDATLADVKRVKVKAAQFRRSLLQAAFTGNLGSDGVRLMTELPDWWQTKKVGELADTQLGKMLNKGKQSGKFAKPYLRTDNVHWGSFDLSEIKEMDIFPEEEEKYLAKKGDLLMCEGGASGRTAIWTQDYSISFQNHVHRIRPKNIEEITPKYLLYYFEWFIKNGFASDLIKGVTISSLSQSGLRSIDVVYPPFPEQHKIVEILEDHLSRLDASVALADAMEKQSAGLRRSLLQAAFTGQLSKEVASV